jgi:excisionase family DNA binding protein
MRISAIAMRADFSYTNHPLGSHATFLAHVQIFLSQILALVDYRGGRQSRSCEGRMSRLSNEQNTEQRPWDLASRVAPYVTVNELARYWTISRKHIYKLIEQGNLPAIRLGPRSLRIRTSDALQFERQGSTELLLNDNRLQPAAQNR